MLRFILISIAVLIPTISASQNQEIDGNCNQNFNGVVGDIEINCNVNSLSPQKPPAVPSRAPPIIISTITTIYVDPHHDSVHGQTNEYFSMGDGRGNIVFRFWGDLEDDYIEPYFAYTDFECKLERQLFSMSQLYDERLLSRYYVHDRDTGSFDLKPGYSYELSFAVYGGEAIIVAVVVGDARPLAIVMARQQNGSCRAVGDRLFPNVRRVIVGLESVEVLTQNGITEELFSHNGEIYSR